MSAAVVGAATPFDSRIHESQNGPRKERPGRQHTPEMQTPNAQMSNPASAGCILCGAGNPGELLFQTLRPILRCATCGLVYADPGSRIASHFDYAEEYYRGGIYADYLADRGVIHKNAFRLLNELERVAKGRSLLDVGCAAGFFLEAARTRGWSVRGLEISDFASDYARRELGLAVDTGSITSAPDGLSGFDVVTLWDTIEHLDRPDQALASIHGLLKPDGVLAFSTGDYSSLLRRLTGSRWRLFGDATHNFFFDVGTLARLLRQQGFEILVVRHAGKWVSLSMILQQSGLPLARTLQAWLKARKRNPAFYVNLRDVVTMFARPIALRDERPAQ